MRALNVSLRSPHEPAGSQTLARLRFGAEPAVVEAGDVWVPLQALSAEQAEVWSAGVAVRRYEAEGFACADDGDYLFFQYLPRADEDIEAAAEQAYARLQALLQNSGYPHLLRVWNYFHDVTGGIGDAERYRRFCAGRLRALLAPGFEQRLPAATVIGTPTPGLHLFGLIAREPGTHLENPRQTSAYRYPRQYGPASPSFARATRVGDTLLVSGTAAIVGHETRHPFDATAQWPELRDNLRALAQHAGGRWRAQSLRLYVRDAQEAATLSAAVQAEYGTDAPLLTLQGDVCRRDLMMEAEAVFTAA